MNVTIEKATCQLNILNRQNERVKDHVVEEEPTVNAHSLRASDDQVGRESINADTDASNEFRYSHLGAGFFGRNLKPYVRWFCPTHGRRYD